MCTSHERHLLRAVALSGEMMRSGNGGPFGAIIVRDNEVIAEGWNKVTTANDPTAHAEIVAIREACAKLDSFSLEGATIYSSCEPCPMCLAAIYWARLDGLYFANSRQDAASIGFDDDLLYREIPKPIAERTMPTVKLDLAEARAIFEEWRVKPDKVMY